MSEDEIWCPNVVDKKLCNAILQPKQKFCRKCKWKIVRCKHFTEDGKPCPGLIPPDSSFCGECGENTTPESPCKNESITSPTNESPSTQAKKEITDTQCSGVEKDASSSSEKFEETSDDSSKKRKSDSSKNVSVESSPNVQENISKTEKTSETNDVKSELKESKDTSQQLTEEQELEFGSEEEIIKNREKTVDDSSSRIEQPPDNSAANILKKEEVTKSKDQSSDRSKKVNEGSSNPDEVSSHQDLPNKEILKDDTCTKSTDLSPTVSDDGEERKVAHGNSSEQRIVNKECKETQLDIGSSVDQLPSEKQNQRNTFSKEDPSGSFNLPMKTETAEETKKKSQHVQQSQPKVLKSTEMTDSAGKHANQRPKEKKENQEEKAELEDTDTQSSSKPKTKDDKKEKSENQPPKKTRGAKDFLKILDPKKSKRDNSTQEKVKATFKATFRALVSSSFVPITQRTTTKIYLTTHESSDIKVEKTLAKSVRHSEDIMEIKVDIECEYEKVPDSEPRFLYYYCKELKDKKSVEFYGLKEVSKKNLRRLVPDDYRRFKFDGVIRGYPGTSFFMYNINQKDMWEDINTSAVAYLSSSMFDKLETTLKAENLISILDDVCHGIIRTYEGFCTNVTRQRIGQMFIEKLQSHQSNIVIAVMKIIIIESYELDIKREDESAIFRYLVLDANTVTRSSKNYTTVEYHYGKSKSQIVDGLLKIIRTTFEQDPEWLQCVPLLHLLTEKCKMFEKMPKEVNHCDTIPVWWGVKEIEDQINNLKKSHWDPMEILVKLEPMFPIDYLLPRTFSAALSLEKLNQVCNASIIPCEVLLAVLYYYVKSKNHPFEKEKQEMLNIISAVAKQIRDSNKKLTSIDNQYTKWYINLYIAQEVMRITQSKRQFESLHICVIEVFLLSLLIFDHFKSTQEANKVDLYVAEEGWSDIRNWMSKFSSYRYPEDRHLKVWNGLFEIVLPECDIKTTFHSLVKKEIEKHLQESYTDPEEVVIQYCSLYRTLNEGVHDIVAKFATECLNKGLQCSGLKGEVALTYGILLSNVFEDFWLKRQLDKEEQPTIILKLTLEWPHFIHFLKTFCGFELSKTLSHNCYMQLTKARSVLESTAEEIMTGEVKLNCLSIVEQDQQRFLDASKALRIDSGDVSQLRDTLQIRLTENSEFQKRRYLVSTYVRMCQGIAEKSETSSLRLGDSVKVSDVCEPKKGVTEVADWHPKLTVFTEFSDHIEKLEQLKSLQKVYLFCGIWRQEGKILQNEYGRQLSVSEVFDQLWSRVVEDSWESTVEGLQTGDIDYQKVKRYFGDDDIPEIQKMLESIPDKAENDRSWISERLKQIKDHRLLEASLAAAKTVLSLVETYELQGDFSPVQNIIQKIKDANNSMQTIDESLISICRQFQNIDKQKIECLEAFIECKALVSWIQTTMSDVKELKVFVDLASISAGEGDMEVAKVKCLHAATTGYAPLIFNLDDIKNYENLFTICTEVWTEMDTDKSLPKKLRDTNRHIEWLESVKKAQGAVEITSMQQVEDINKKGTYVIGRINQKAHAKILSIDDVLELHISKESGKNEKLPFKELKELQGKLMLVAGKAELGKDEVERFIMILDSAIRLSRVYIRLLAAGCVLFTDWKGTFFCDPSCVVCAIIQFGNAEQGQQRGRRNQNEDVSTVIPKLAHFMETCLENWLKYIDEKRDDYKQLNYFTIDQMVILQKELVRVGTENPVSKLIYPLLSIIKTDCTPTDLIESIKKAKVEVKKLEDRNEGRTEDDKERKFIAKMVKIGYREDLAKEALKNGIKPSDESRGIGWCFENRRRFENELKKKENNIAWKEPSKSTMNDMIFSTFEGEQRESAFEPLLKNLEGLWEKYIESVSSGMVDCLSVSHLGMILQQLANAGMKKVDRKLPPCFEKGVLNLLLCRKDELLHTVLTIYNYEKNIEQPLPLPEEVLLCTPKTTSEEIDIFWRRSLFDTSGRIYCLVNADCLSYEVADYAEHRLEHHVRKSQSDCIHFNLVIVCDVEHEYQSRIIAALDKHKRSGLPVDVGEIRHMLKEKLKNENENVAASADWERSTVRVIKSWRAGVGKTLFKRRVANLVEKIPCLRENNPVISISLHQSEIQVDEVMKKLLDNTLPPGKIEPRLIHIDFSHEVQDGLDFFLFQLLIIGCLTNSYGHVWRKMDFDMYIVETMPIRSGEKDEKTKTAICRHSCLNILPDAICRSPLESLQILKKKDYSNGKFGIRDILFDEMEFANEYFQRPFQYLSQRTVDLNHVAGTPKECLETLLEHCGIQDPSWAELRNFVWFLNTQLKDYENSVFIAFAGEDALPGFPEFVLQFLIQMSRDFSTRSLQLSEESADIDNAYESSATNEDENAILRQYQMKRTWESSPHPYLFFNADHNSMTFVGFKVDKKTGNITDHRTGDVLSNVKITRLLYEALERNHVDLNEDFDKLQRMEKLKKLYSVMGIDIDINAEDDEDNHDPDPTYELTTDNVKKILAVYMRFRSDIPVVIMGETGCGKTRLVKFLCDIGLKRRPKEKFTSDTDKANMIIMKVHGGTTSNDIKRKVEEAKILTEENIKIYGENMFTVLFLDEANTTEAIGTIKEIMCDRSIEGEPLRLGHSLKIVAACNPYKRHSDELIKALEQAGLGYHVDADKTTDRMGRLPMRRLVYRVQPLPQSLIPLVWDFGQLSPDVENLYIKQMVIRYINEGKLPNGLEDVVSSVLTASQVFMRNQKDQCSFVSLRDVERVLDVMAWFYAQSKSEEDIFCFCSNNSDSDSETDSDNDSVLEEQPLEPETLSLIMAIGVCYHACLMNREHYREHVSKSFKNPCELHGGPNRILTEIDRCQKILLENIDLGKNIAKNQALQENLFMMVISIELRIPLFLVGKPGSSKSMAKTIVADAMQGTSAHTALFKNLKQAQMVSFQCSPLSVSEGIIGTFRQCAMYQKDKDLGRFVSVVVLDEVGLAEDSPRMPLKALHSLLEDGCQDDDAMETYRKVAFIGISNWALDPAKMNRGLLVQRGVPDKIDLVASAKGIWESGKSNKFQVIETYLQPLAESYLQVFDHVHKIREFFGLRDFYSLIKMLYGYCAKKDPTWHILQHCVLRNFSGFDGCDKSPWQIFEENLLPLFDDTSKQVDDPECSPAALIEACLRKDQLERNEEGALIDRRERQQSMTSVDTRYLLLLTENYGALSILQQKIPAFQNATTIFGSNFPSDQEYTQVCRNINRIKVCMEAGTTVVLLNLENLYESLYDALNQCYVYFGGERYVDLGLGSHRVKCRVHQRFRLIVVAEKETVYKQFPIPLINRLEKHFLNISTLLSEFQKTLEGELKKWVGGIVKRTQSSNYQLLVGHAFMGHHEDSCAAAVIDTCKKYEQNESDQDEERNGEQILNGAKETLLWSATPDAVLRFRQSFPEEGERIQRIYFRQQNHESLLDFLKYSDFPHPFVQITTHSQLLTFANIDEISAELQIPGNQLRLMSLQSFETEQQFSRQIKYFFDGRCEGNSILIVQCDSGTRHGSWIASAQHCIHDIMQSIADSGNRRARVFFVIHLPRIGNDDFTGFQCGVWKSVHIDDVRNVDDGMPATFHMIEKTLGNLLEEAVQMLDQSNQKNVLNVASLSNSCLYSSLRMIRDMSQTDSRIKERLAILVIHLRNYSKTGANLVSGIALHMLSILNEKESGLPDIFKSSVKRDATSWDKIIRAGTFRKAILQCFEEKLSPILALIIAKSDINNNLDILQSREKETWQEKIWIQIINNPSTTGIKYQQLTSPQNRQLKEVVVESTGSEGHSFSANVPFSWLIIDYIETMIKTEKDVNLDRDISEIIANSQLGKILLNCIEEDEGESAMKMYMKDFVHTMYPVSHGDTELQIICKSLKSYQERQMGDANIIDSFIAIHLAHQSCSTNLKNFADIMNHWPECSTRIEKDDQTSRSWLGNAMPLDFLGLHHVLLKLDPDPEDETEKHFDLNCKAERIEWLRDVHLFRPIIEHILAPASQDFYNTGEENVLENLSSARKKWTRVVVMKLFLEYVFTTEEYDTATVMGLWHVMGENVDLTNVSDLNKIAEYMRIYIKSAVEDTFGLQDKCAVCERTIEAVPVQYPCGKVICVECNENTALQSDNCRACNEKHTEDISIDPEKYLAIRRNCNGFFLDVITQLCFQERNTSSRNLLNNLLLFATMESKIDHGWQITSKELCSIDRQFESEQIFSHFLLQHIFRNCSKENAKESIEWYLARTERRENKTEIDLLLLFLYCYETSLYQHDVKEEHLAKKTLRAIRYISANSQTTFPISKVDNLLCLAELRYGLSVTSNVFYELCCRKSSVELPEDDWNDLVSATRRICELSESKQPRLFLIKHICRSHGIDAYSQICKQENMQWLSDGFPQKEILECADRFLVTLQEYKQVRDLIALTMLDGDIDCLTPLKTLALPRHQLEIIILLAIFRQIAFANWVEGVEGERKEIVNEICNYLCSIPSLSRKVDLIRSLCGNSAWNEDSKLKVSKGLNINQQNIICLLHHFYIVIMSTKDILTPLQKLIEDPKSMQNSFLPTMPLDYIDQVAEELLAHNEEGATGETLTMYLCTNGHPYVLGDCGRPWVELQCKRCGVPIGGKWHQLTEGNVKYEGDLSRSKGHILGSGEEREASPKQCRDLGGIQCSILRFFTHAAMYIGASKYPEDIQKMIKPKVQPEDVTSFLWCHIECDLRTIQRATGENTDNVLLFLHRICHEMMMAFDGTRYHSTSGNILSGVKERRKWETNVSCTIIDPMVEEIQQTLMTMNDAILKDEKMNFLDPLYRLINESDVQSMDIDTVPFHEMAQAWRYKPQMTLEHLQHVLLGKTPESKYPTLYAFIQQENILRYIHFVPNILRLQRLLQTKFHRKVDRDEVKSMTINRMIETFDEDGNRGEVRELVTDFFHTWQGVREHLPAFYYQGLQRIPAEVCQHKLTEMSCADFLIPSLQGNGLCSVNLLVFLLDQQNSFLDLYHKNNKKETYTKDAHMDHITAAHLIDYHPERDVLPVILSNCNIEFGNGKDADYNFQNMERQIIDRFLFSKSPIKIKIEMISLVTFRAESTNCVVLQNLRSAVKQEPLPPSFAKTVCDEIRTYPEVCESLNRLDIAIYFLTSMKGDQDMYLENFMINILKMDSTIPSQQVKSRCQCKHAQFLWIALAFQKTKFEMSSDQEIIPGVDQMFRRELNDDQEHFLRESAELVPPEHLDIFLEILFECIMLNITIPEENEEDNRLHTSLHDTMVGYISARAYDIDEEFPDWTVSVLGRIILNEGDMKIENCQAINTLMTLYETSCSKRDQM